MYEKLMEKSDDEKKPKFKESSKSTYIKTLAFSILLLAVAIYTIGVLEGYFINIGLLDWYLQGLPLIVIIGLGIFVACAFLFTYGLGLIVFKIIEKKIHLIEFTFNLHRKWHGDDDLYFFEYFTGKEDLSTKANFTRALYGAILVLGISIMIIENFLTIPDLEPFFWSASLIVMLAMFAFIPIIIIFLYCSPLITKEINLYFHDKRDRTVRNVGGWLDDGLQLFAAIDIILVAVIIIDTTTINEFWLIFITCLTLGVFSLFLTVTAIFNRKYHVKFNLQFKFHLAQKYKIPVRRVDLPARTYFCQNPDCGALIDYINLENCDKCGYRIRKCSICGDVLDKDHGGEMSCPDCGLPAHEDELISWVKLRGTCPSCKREIKLKTN